jgi:serine protease Do
MRRLVVVVFLLLVTAAVVDARAWSWLGVRIRDLSEQEMDAIAQRHGIREGYGVMIVEVIDGTPAARAGLRNGDIVVAFADRPVVETRVLQRFIAAAPVEIDTLLTVLRSEGRQRLRVRLVPMPRAVAGERVAAELGFVLRESEGQPEVGGARLAGSAPTVGVVIRGGSAERAGMEVGDVLLQVNEHAVVTRDAAREALAEASLERPLRLTVRRGQALHSLTLPAP